jgi:hypothetical protein
MESDRIKMAADTETFKLVGAVDGRKPILCLCFGNSIEARGNVRSYTFDSFLVISNLGSHFFD